MTGGVDLATVERDYRRHGYAVLDGIVPSSDIASITALVGDVQRGVRSLPASLVAHLVMERDLPVRDGDEAYTDDATFILGSPPVFHRRFAALAIHPVITDAVRTLLQTAAITYHFSNVTTKRPISGRRISWHRDYPNDYINQVASTFVRVMVCLDGMTHENGATAFLSGSHLVSDEDACRGPLTPQIVDANRTEPAICAAGSLVFIHPKVVHGSGRNVSRQFRRNFVVQWGDSSVPFSTANEEILTGFGVADIERWLGRDRPASENCD